MKKHSKNESRQMKSKVFTFMILLLFAGQATWAVDHPVAYGRYSWDDVKNELKMNTPSAYATVLTGDHHNERLTMDGNVHYWTAEDNADYEMLIVKGEEQHLILSDNCRLTVQHIKIEEGSTLHIYAQQGLNTKLGELIVKNDKFKGYAGIGGDKDHSCGNLFIHGGNIHVTAAKNGAAIGGGEDTNGGNITIYHGTVTAIGTTNGAGIGGGYAGCGGHLTIYGGTVTAQGGVRAAGIGGGNTFNGGGGVGDITIWGGTVEATGGDGGAGIGGGWACKTNDGTVTINGGDVTALGTINGAGIGGGENGNGCKVVINGGTVKAIASSYFYNEGSNGSAAIGGGYQGNGGDVTINGGNVTCIDINMKEQGQPCSEFIGRGSLGNNDGKFVLGDNVRVMMPYNGTSSTWADFEKRYYYCSAKCAKSAPTPYYLIHLEFNPDGAPASQHSANSLSMDFEDVSGIGSIETNDSEINDSEINARYFDLSGRELPGKPAHGAYIHNGKKYFVK